MSFLRQVLNRVRNGADMPVPHVVSVIEYMQHFDDFSPEERSDAVSVLRGFHTDVSPGAITKLQARYYGAKPNWRFACIRCGQIVSAGTKRTRGLGRTCYSVVGTGTIRNSGRKLGPPVEADLVDATPFVEWKNNGRP